MQQDSEDPRSNYEWPRDESSRYVGNSVSKVLVELGNAIAVPIDTKEGPSYFLAKVESFDGNFLIVKKYRREPGRSNRFDLEDIETKVEETTPVVCNPHELFFENGTLLTQSAEEYIENESLFKSRWPEKFNFYQNGDQLCILVRVYDESKSALLLYSDGRQEWTKWPDPRLKELNKEEILSMLPEFNLRLEGMKDEWTKELQESGFIPGMDICVYWEGDECWYPGKLMWTDKKACQVKYRDSDPHDAKYERLKFTNFNMEPRNGELVWRSYGKSQILPKRFRKLYNPIFDEDTAFRCVCCNDDLSGKLVQCEGCDVWQHLECVSFGLNLDEVRYFCEECEPNHLVHYGRYLVKREKRLGRIAKDLGLKAADIVTVNKPFIPSIYMTSIVKRDTRLMLPPHNWEDIRQLEGSCFRKTARKYKKQSKRKLRKTKCNNTDSINYSDGSDLVMDTRNSFDLSDTRSGRCGMKQSRVRVLIHGDYFLGISYGFCMQSDPIRVMLDNGDEKQVRKTQIATTDPVPLKKGMNVWLHHENGVWVQARVTDNEFSERVNVEAMVENKLVSFEKVRTNRICPRSKTAKMDSCLTPRKLRRRGRKKKPNRQDQMNMNEANGRTRGKNFKANKRTRDFEKLIHKLIKKFERTQDSVEQLREENKLIQNEIKESSYARCNELQEFKDDLKDDLMDFLRPTRDDEMAYQPPRKRRRRTNPPQKRKQRNAQCGKERKSGHDPQTEKMRQYVKLSLQGVLKLGAVEIENFLLEGAEEATSGGEVDVDDLVDGFSLSRLEKLKKLIHNFQAKNDVGSESCSSDSDSSSSSSSSNG